MMEKKENKIDFIICTNDAQALQECKYYISRLEVPAGYMVGVIDICDAVSMTSGYNRAIELSDAKYKVYMHQDVLIINKYFIHALLGIFRNKTIGMIGMVGSRKLPSNAIMWCDHRVGSLIFNSYHQGTTLARFDDGKGNEIYSVEAIDGFMMITQYDIKWRDDIFDGWDFYDVSQSNEFRNAGYKVVVPHQDVPWCIHDDGYCNFNSYHKYRKIFIDEYLKNV